MPEAAVAAVAWAVSVIGAEVGSAVLIMNAVEIATAIVAASAVYVVASQAEQARQDAKAAHNAALRDRYNMVRGATEPRQMVLGRARVSGPLTFISSYGPNREHLIFALVLAAHEIDAVETIYFDNHPVLMDAMGAVYGVQQKDVFSISGVLAAPNNVFTLSAPPKASTVVARATYGSTVVALGATVSGSVITLSGGNSGQTGLIEILYQPDPCPFVNATNNNATDWFQGSATAGATVTLSQAPLAGSVVASYSAAGSGGDTDSGGYSFVAESVSVNGNRVTVSAPSSSMSTANLVVQYQVTPVVSSKARIKIYTGAPGQVADPDMLAAFPTLWTANHIGNGLAYLRIEFDYDPTAFPGGLPNISAVVRGAKVYDPRSGLTAWSDNPSLLLRYAATSPLCGRLDAALVPDATVITAANVCDVSTSYIVGGQTYVRKLYTAGMSAKTTLRPQDVLNDLAQAMGGKWMFTDGLLRVKAGSFTTPARMLDESWLHEAQQIHIQPKHARADIFNVVTGVFADASLDYQVSPMPRVAPAAYITEDGVELPHDLTMSAVQFTGQAQHIASCALRELRAGLTMTVLCNYRAYEIEVFDVINVSLSRFGWVNKMFEVTSVDWSLTGGIQLSLKATDASIATLDAAFLAFNPATATRLPSPWIIAPVLGLNALSGTAQLLKQSDGTIVSRLLVKWTSVADQAVVSGGQIEIRYGLAYTSQSTWTSVMAPGGDTQVYVPQSVKDLSIYVVQARAWNSFTSGQWSLPILCQVIGKTARPGDVAGFTATPAQAGVVFAWTRNSEVDFSKTTLRLGATWATATQIFAGDATGWTWTSAPAGTYTVLAKHIDTTGNESLTAASVTVTVSADAVLARANAAYDAAQTAGTQLVALLDDGVLSPSEKPLPILLYANITYEQAGINAQATAFSVDHAAYDAAIVALTTYLNSVSTPVAWNSLAGNTTADGPTMRNKFNAVYAARQAVLNATAAAAGTVSTWSGTTGPGKPTDYANSGGVGGYVNSDPMLRNPSEWTSNTPYRGAFNEGDGIQSAWDRVSGGPDNIFSAPFPISASKTYLIESAIYKTANTTATHFLLIAFYDATGALISGYDYATGWPGVGTYHYYGLLGTAPAVNAVNRYSLIFGAGGIAKIPPNAVAAKVGILGAYSDAGRWSWGGARVLSMSGTGDIVDNSVNQTAVYSDAAGVFMNPAV